MNDADDRTARAWIRLQRSWWAHDALFTACASQPKKAWRLLRRIEELATTKDLIGDLGAGPLEDFIRAHAPAFIGPIERRAAKEARFRRALRCVRLPRAEDAVSQRLFALGVEPVDVRPDGWQVVRPPADEAG